MVGCITCLIIQIAQLSGSTLTTSCRQQLPGEHFLGLSDRYPWVNKGRSLGYSFISRLQNMIVRHK